jgi:predicted nucleotidyltransferase
MVLTERQVVDGKARYAGHTLAEWVTEAVDALVASCHPVRVVLFGSVARGDDGPNSDIDLLMIIDDTDDQRAAAIAALKAVAGLGPEVDVMTVPAATAEAKRHVAGTLIRPALREGKVVYERAA